MLINLIKSYRIINFQCLLHVSSAYVNSNISYAMEKIYDAPANYDDVINYVQTTDINKLNIDENKLVI